jgi:biopolymer transport protein ExbD
MSKSHSQSARAEPNLTPMLDMVFQLVTFFMLVINFKSNQIDARMDLPVVGSARPVKAEGVLMMMLNINNRGEFTVFNKPYSDQQMAQYIAAQAETDRLAMRRARADFDDADDLPTTVVIRADRNTPFEKLDRALKLCQANHYRNFAFRTTTAAAHGKPTGSGTGNSAT